MLRATSSSLKSIPVLRNASIYFPVKQYTTPAAPTPDVEKKEKSSLSKRLGGSGRASAKKSRGPNNNSNNNNRRNGNFTPRPRKQQQENNGQFTDAAEKKTENNTPRQPRGDGAKKFNNKPRTQQRPSKEGAALTEGGNNNNKRQPRTNNNNNNNNKNNRNRENGDGQRKSNNRKLNLRSQPQEVRTRRATTFIDRDIDWASFDTAVVTENTEIVAEKDDKEDSELLLKDIQGDYSRYLEVGSSLSWPKMVDGATISTLVGSNPTFDLSQKTAFMAAVSSATGGQVSARK
ncbi:unnamed protein product [Mucor hiemalis]